MYCTLSAVTVSCVTLFCSLQLKTFTRVSGRVYHIEADIQHNESLFFSTPYGFYTVNVSEQPPTPQLIAGREGKVGYLEGKGMSIQNSCIVVSG